MPGALAARSSELREPGRWRGREASMPGRRGRNVAQFDDLTDFAGQKRDLRTMEPVSEITGHCFVVGD